MNKSSKIYLPVIVMCLIAVLAGLLMANLPVPGVQAQVGPPGGPGGPGGPRGPRPTPNPTAQVNFLNGDKVISPEVLSKGIPMTYTFQIKVASGSIDARDAVFEQALIGNQQFVGFSSSNPNWKLREPVGNTLFVELGNLKANDGGTITIQAIFPTNYDRTIFRQTVYLNWNDDYASRHAGMNLTAPIKIDLPGPPAPVADPGPVQRPSEAGIPESGPFAGVADPGRPNSEEGWYFPATRHTLHGEFLNYWRSHGSLPVLGFPVSEEFTDGGRTIQYFERVVMEFWPENPPAYRVLLRALGREAGVDQTAVRAESRSPEEGSVYYAETGHWLDGRFVATWREQGGLAQFGFPIAEPYVENEKLIQWTERARFELALSRPYQLVMLGLVGVESGRARGYLK